VAPKGKGLKRLCAALRFVFDANLAIANDAMEEGNSTEFNEAIDVCNQATDDMNKYGCGTAARARQRIAKLKKTAIGRGRRASKAGGRKKTTRVKR
jgi:hypothetical protein